MNVCKEAKIDVLGTTYTVKLGSHTSDPRAEGSDGFCDDTAKELFAETFETESCEPTAKKNLKLQTEKVLRHEIIHAFLCESGLAECSEWAQNEEMVDWFAKQAPKLVRAWRQAGTLDMSEEG